jgi:hypothetical protein
MHAYRVGILRFYPLQAIPNIRGAGRPACADIPKKRPRNWTVFKVLCIPAVSFHKIVKKITQ